MGHLLQGLGRQCITCYFGHAASHCRGGGCNGRCNSHRHRGGGYRNGGLWLKTDGHCYLRRFVCGLLLGVWLLATFLAVATVTTIAVT